MIWVNEIFAHSVALGAAALVGIGLVIFIFSRPMKRQSKTLIAYVDESYTLDGKKDVIAIAGWLTDAEAVREFCPVWQKVLDSYGAKQFHFHEYVDKKHLYSKTNRYDGWDELKRECYLFDMALAASELGIPVGGCSAPDRTKTKSLDAMTLKRKAYRMFFDCVLVAVSRSQFKPFNPKTDRIEFVFDNNDDPSWQQALAETFKEYKDNGAPFSDYDAKGDDSKCLPLQAADLYVFSLCKNAERFFGENKMQSAHGGVLEFILQKNRHDLENWQFSKEHWIRLVLLVVNHYREWKVANPGKKYLPLVHFDMLKPPTD
jgi:hypothetical protein